MSGTVSQHDIGVSPPDNDIDAIDREAAEWIVRLTGDDAGERERARAGFEVWRNQGPLQAAAATRLQGFIQRLQGVREQTGGDTRPARAALNAVFPAKRRPGRRSAAALVLLLIAALPLWFGLRAWPAAYLLADVRTGIGQWETRTLPDGSRITLDSGSAVNLHYDDQHRAVELVRGAVLVDVAKDPARPFLVESAEGDARALGTRFVVSRDEDVAILSVIESKVTVRAADAAVQSPPIEAGQRIAFSRQGLGRIETLDANSLSDAWRFHQLVVDNQSLPEVLDALSRYRHGVIHYDRAQLAGIRISAVLPLDRPEQALQLLHATLPTLRIRTLTPYVVLVDAPATGKEVVRTQ